MPEGALSGGTVSLGVRPDTSKFAPDLHKSLGGSAGHFAKIGLGIGAALLGGLAARKIGETVGSALRTGFGEAFDASKGLAQLNAGLKSTKAVSGTTAQGLMDLAGSIQDYSGQTDDSIVATEQLLLTFTNIRNVGPNKIFDETTQAAADMAARLGGDASRSAIQLGKALNDPIKGVTALQRVGVSFTQGQKDTIKQMVLTGNTIGAQKLILGELNKEFGGSAKAAGETLPGALQRARRGFEDIAQSAAETLTPSIQHVVDKFVNLEHQVRDSPAFKAILKRFGDFAAHNSDKLIKFFEKGLNFFKSSAKSPLGGLVTQLEKASPLFAVFAAVGKGLKSVMPVLVKALEKIAPALIPIIPSLAKVAVDLLPALAQIIVAILPIIPPLASIIGSLSPVLSSLAGTVAGALSSWVEFSNFLSGDESITDWLKHVSSISGLVGGIFTGLQNIVVGFVNGIIDNINHAIDGIFAVINGLRKLAGLSALAVPHVGKAATSQDVKNNSGAHGTQRGHGKGIALATGADILPTPGGTQVTVGEGGRKETVVDYGKTNKLIDRALNAGGGDQPVYTDTGELFGWIKKIADGRSRLVFNQQMTAMAVQMNAGGLVS